MTLGTVNEGESVEEVFVCVRERGATVEGWQPTLLLTKDDCLRMRKGCFGNQDCDKGIVVLAIHRLGRHWSIRSRHKTITGAEDMNITISATGAW